MLVVGIKKDNDAVCGIKEVCIILIAALRLPAKLLSISLPDNSPLKGECFAIANAPSVQEIFVNGTLF